MWAIAMQQTDAFNQWKMGSTSGPSHPTFSPRNYQLGVVKLILLRARCRQFLQTTCARRSNMGQRSRSIDLEIIVVHICRGGEMLGTGRVDQATAGRIETQRWTGSRRMEGELSFRAEATEPK